MKKQFFLLLFVTTIFLSSNLMAQNQMDTTLVRIITNDGNDYVGNVLNETETAIQINTQILGQITIQKKDIKSTGRNQENWVTGNCQTPDVFCDYTITVVSYFQII